MRTLPARLMHAQFPDMRGLCPDRQQADCRAERRISCGQVPSLERVEHLPHRFWVAAHDRGGGLDVAGGIKVLPGEREPGAAGERREEGPLRPPVALSERGERVAAQAAQAVFVVQFADDDGCGGEKVCALFGRALPRDFLDVDATLTTGMYTREQLLELAAESDHRFDPLLFADALGALTQITDAAFAEYGTDPQVIADMRRRFAEWRRLLTDKPESG
jgi:hypothetical protein